MARVAALGEQVRVAGLALAGVTVLVAEHPDAVRTAWRDMEEDVGLVILTPAAADVLGPEVCERVSPLTAVLPP
ncbi:V-type ATP synthase subunit F [Streptomyces sp. NPDC021749]|uniref:V-type ATP synthase subunit F n=1 Tax=Streptomyces sp. NPDC021749 TaxID=3154905 RepID=UPI0033DF6714